MSLTLLTPPAEEPLALADLKFFLRVGHDTDDALITSLALAARQQVEALTGLALVTQEWRLTLDRWPAEPVRLPHPPVQAITAVSVQDDAGDWQTLDAEDYTLALTWPARLILNGIPPYPAVPAGGIRIDFTTGFGDADAVPDTLKQAIRLLTAHYHENREAVAERRLSGVPQSVASLIAPWREVRL